MDIDSDIFNRYSDTSTDERCASMNRLNWKLYPVESSATLSVRKAECGMYELVLSQHIMDVNEGKWFVSLRYHNAQIAGVRYTARSWDDAQESAISQILSEIEKDISFLQETSINIKKSMNLESL